MKTSKNSKRALLCSALSIALCLSMLIGTTFAWFTDTATANVNKIESGTLKVDIVDANDTTTSLKETTLNFLVNGAVPAEGTQILWEPGATFKTQSFKIKNSGNLALKYKMVINGATGDTQLLDVITFSLVDENSKTVDLSTFEGHLTAAEPLSNTYYIQGTMATTAGNDYQGLSMENLAITVYATQDTVESDSNGNTYDKNATYPVSDYSSLKKAFEGSGVYNVTEDLDVEETLSLTGFNALKLDATGKTVSNTTDLWDTDKGNWSLLSAQGSSRLTVAGGKFEAKENDCYAVDVQDGATLTIEDGTFVGNIHAVYVEKGTAYIKGGKFSVQQKYSADKPDEFVLNCYDANRANGTAKIIVTGGTFVNFNPADCYAEGAHTNFVADGYKVVSETQSNGDVWYTVVAE